MKWRIAGAALLVSVFALPLVAVDARADEEVFAFDDDRIIESSGLVDLGSLMVTVNDSGDSARVFTLDARTGRTVGVTSFGAEAVDDEALAPAGKSAVWVGDLGDNSSSRDDVTVSRVPVGRRQLDVADPESYTLRYPDGAHDAESLLVAPGGDLYVITKSLQGGTVYRTAGPLRRSGANVLRRVAEVGDYATDAALLRDGRHVLVRSPAQASVYTFPGFEVVGRFPLPHQQQGEGVSVGPDGRIRLSSEGRGSAVLQIDLPAGVRTALATPSGGPSSAGGSSPVESSGSPLPTASPVALPDVPETRDPGYDSSTLLGWAAAGAVGVIAVVVGFRLGRRG